ncbi:MAG: protein kinase [Verrucomicrobia bacterium]|nr:protein kinase [Verrucomicrobiota bacterium]
MSSGPWCPKCGARVPADAPEGFCSSCLLQAGLLGFPDDDLACTDAGPAAPSFLRDFGDFELLEELGRGGMGVVYKARQKSLNRVVALKMIQSGRLARDSDLRRFRTEAEATARLQHPHIVPVHEIGTQEGQHYFTMDFVAGRSLSELLREGPLPARQAAAHLHAIAGAVQHAHERGVLHRDLKPSNVLLDAAGQPRVTDFGLAKLLEGGPEVTCSGAVVGSPGYMAPEQAAGQSSHASVRSDVYSLGAILYDLLCARPPFQADTALETMRLVQQAEPVPPRLLNPRLPRDLETICLKCLEKDPAKRYATAQELVDDLSRFLDDEPIRARPVGRAEKTWRWCRRNPALAGSLAGTFLLLVAVAVGASVVAQRLHRASHRALAAERDAQEKLWASYLAQARAGRLSGVAGRRRESLAAIAAAAKMRPSLELRNEAIACLALADIEPPVTVHPNLPAVPADWSTFDSAFERYAVLREGGSVTLHAVKDQRVLAELAAPTRGQPRGAFSPDGRFLFANFAHGKLFLWDLDGQKSEEPLAATRDPQSAIRNEQAAAYTNFPPVRDAARSATFSPDSRTFAIAGKDGFIHFYDLGSSRREEASNLKSQISDFKSPERLTSAATPSELTATASSLPDLAERTPLPVGAAAYRLDFDPSGQRLAVMIGGEVQLWNLVQRMRTKTLQRPIDGVVMGWHPDGRHLAVGFRNGELWFWDTETGEARQLWGHAQYVSSIAFDPLGALLVTDSWDGQTLFWDAALGRLLFAHRLGVSCAFSADGQWLGVHYGPGGLDRARVLRSRVFRQWTSPSLKSPQLSGVDLSADGRWLVVGDGTGWGLWDLEQGKQLAFVQGTRGGHLQFHPNGRSVITFTSDEVLQWALEVTGSTGDSPVPFGDPPNGTTEGTGKSPSDRKGSGLPGIPSGRLPDGTGGSPVLPTGNTGLHVGAARVLVSSPGSLFQDVSMSADGTLLAVAGVNRSLVVDLNERGRARTLTQGHVDSQIALSPDKRWVAVTSATGSVTVWDALTGQFQRQLLTNEHAAIALSPDGRVLATATGRECCWWESDTWQVRRRFPLSGTGEMAGFATFSPDGRFFALAAGRRKLTLYDAHSGDELGILTAPALQNAEPLAFSGDGHLLAAGTAAGVVQLWDLRELRRELAALSLDW